MATWQEECQSRGGAVTVLPKTPDTPPDKYSYVPVCRMSNGDGTSSYIDMRSVSETWDDNIEQNEIDWDIAMGKAVTIRDTVVDAAEKVVKWSFTTIALAAAVGLALYSHLEKKK